MLNPPQPPSLFQYNPVINNKFNLFKTNELKSVNVFLESNKNKNFNVEYNSLLAGNDLSKAEEYTNKINYGVKTIGGGVFSLSSINQKTYGMSNTQSYLGLGYTLQSPYTTMTFNFRNINNPGVVLPSDTTLLEFNFRSKF